MPARTTNWAALTTRHLCEGNFPFGKSSMTRGTRKPIQSNQSIPFSQALTAAPSNVPTCFVSHA